jgi:hypothetical protein
MRQPKFDIPKSSAAVQRTKFPKPVRSSQLQPHASLTNNPNEVFGAGRKV